MFGDNRVFCLSNSSSMEGVMILLIILMAAFWCVACLGAFIAGRTYERKQFVRVGKPIKTTQEVLRVFKK